MPGDEMADFILGVDLGQARDYTAITVLEVTPVLTGKLKKVFRMPSPQVWIEGRCITGGEPSGPAQVPATENHYQARHLERLPMGTSYPKQVERVKELHDYLLTLPAYKTTKDGLQQPVKPKVSLVADKTGAGAAVIDMLRAAELKPIAITITGGDTVTRDGRDYRVPKRDLVSVAQVLLQSERLKIAKELPEAQTLISELLAFKVSINLRGHDSYGNDVGMWRENPHDDLVLAVALAAWYGENRPKLLPPIPQVRVISTR
jgi:hypothetical protein